MKKIALFRKYGESAEFVARFDSVEEASDQVKDIINEDEDANVFDFYTEEQEYTDIRERVKTYADACEVLGIAEMDEKAFKACGFRPDEIARRKLETITEALNEGWRPDWNNTNEYKYFPWFRILPGKGKDAEGKPLSHIHN
nr:hypothetical protein [Paramuribaculum intestinale]